MASAVIIPLCCILFAVLPAELCAADAERVGPFVLTGKGVTADTCPSQEERIALR